MGGSNRNPAGGGPVGSAARRVLVENNAVVEGVNRRLEVFDIIEHAGLERMSTVSGLFAAIRGVIDGLKELWRFRRPLELKMLSFG